jgi:O-antigen ligase
MIGTAPAPVIVPEARWMQRLPVWSVTILVLWGVAAFGSVYEWGLIPLMIGALFAAVTMVGCFRTSDRVQIALTGIVLGAGVLQLVPLPARAMPSARDAVLRQYDVGFSEPTSGGTLSVDPLLSTRAVGCGAVIALYGLTLAAWLRGRARGVSIIARNVAIVAAVVALQAIVQKGTFNEKIYWFWTADSGAWGRSNYFGPFVNRNHFAGWMILAASLSVGRLAALVSKGFADAKPGWRHRILWLSTPAAGALLLSATAVMVAITSLTWSMSRSGIAGGLLAMLIVSVTGTLRMTGTARKVLLPVAVITLVTAGLATKGATTLALWYSKTDTLQWRFNLWRDTMAPLRDFWLTGSGLNTYGVLTLVYPQTDTTVYAARAHNDYLQLAVEGGLLVGIPVLVAAFALARTILRRLRTPQDEATWWIRLGAVAGICGIAVQEITDFSLQIPGVAVLFAVVVAIAIHDPAGAAERRESQPRARRSSTATARDYA